MPAFNGVFPSLVEQDAVYKFSNQNVEFTAVTLSILCSPVLFPALAIIQT